MDRLSPTMSPLDYSSCEDSPGPDTPELSPLLQPLVLGGDSVGERVRQFLVDAKLRSVKDAHQRDPVDTLRHIAIGNRPVRHICFIGAGYVGGPTAAVIALHNPSIRVEVVDRDASRIARWKSSHLPIFEPGLSDVVRVSRDGATVHAGPVPRASPRLPNLFFTTNSHRSISQADVVFVAVNTPTKTFGAGAGRATNMTAFDGAVKEVATLAKPGTIIVEKSTVPCGTAQRIRSTLQSVRPGVPFEVLSNPEFLAEGSAIDNLMTPDRVIIGCNDSPSGRVAADVLAGIYTAWVPPSKIMRSNVWSSELSKLVANAMLAQRISSINSISAICEETGAHIDEIARCIGLDPRIGPHFLKAGLGFGGSCFRKDIASLTYLAESLGLDEVADYWAHVNGMNVAQRARFAKKVVRRLDDNLVGRKLAILGFAFKKNTGDTRESLAVDVVAALAAENPAEIAIFDPRCKRADVVRELSLADIDVDAENSAVRLLDDPYDACAGADAILVVTDHDEFAVRTTRADSLSSTPSTCPELEGQDAATPTTPSPNPSSIKDAPAPPAQEIFHLTNLTSYALAPESRCAAGAAACPDCRADAEAQLGKHGEHEPRGWAGERVDWATIIAKMKRPRLIFDGRGVLDVKAVESLGSDVVVERIGVRHM